MGYKKTGRVLIHTLDLFLDLLMDFILILVINYCFLKFKMLLQKFRNSEN